MCSQVREFHTHGPPTFLIFNRVLFPTQHTPPNIAELFLGPEGKAVRHSHSEARSVAPGEDGGRYQLAPPQRACGGLFSAPSPLCPWRIPVGSPGLESSLHYYGSEQPWLIHVGFPGLCGLLCGLRKVMPSQTSQ